MARLAQRPLISLVFPVRNEGNRVRKTIDAMVAGRSEPFPLQIVVADDASSDGCCTGLERLYTPGRDKVEISVVTLRQWSGICAGRNAGAARARGEILFCTDSDVIFPAGWDIPVRQHIRPGRVLAAVIGDIASGFLGYGGTLMLDSMNFCWLRDPNPRGGFVPMSAGPGTILQLELFRKLGGFENLLPFYGADEPEFGARVWMSGAEIVCIPDLVLMHRFKTPEERAPFLRATRLIQVRNYLRFAHMYLDAEGIRRVYRFYANRCADIIDEAYRDAIIPEVLARREHLLKTMPVSFAEYAATFRLGTTADATPTPA